MLFFILWTTIALVKHNIKIKKIFFLSIIVWNIISFFVKVTSEDIVDGTSLFLLKALLPVAESFGKFKQIMRIFAILLC